MRSVSVRLCDLENIRLNMGYVGENEHVHVLFDCKKAFDQYPNAVPSLVVVPPKGDSYPAVVTREGDIVEWVITDSDLIYAGNGKIQLQFQQGDIVMKSAEMRTFIAPSAIATGDIPTPIQNWIAQANAILAAIPDDINAALAEAQASGVFDGVGIASIEKTGTSGNVDTYTITLTDESSYEFTVTNGTPGQNGVGIQSIAKTGTSGLVDTYTITLTNNQTYTFTVTNGENGVQIDDVTPANNKVFSSAKVDEELNLLKSEIAGIEYGGKTLSKSVKNAFLDLFAHVAYTDGNAQQYIDALKSAWGITATLSAITAVFAQGSAVIMEGDDLDTLKTYLTVNGIYVEDGNTFEDEVTGYTLSGTLSEGESTITVTYNGLTTTFVVVVTSSLPSAYKKVEWIGTTGTQAIMFPSIIATTTAELEKYEFDIDFKFDQWQSSAATNIAASFSSYGGCWIGYNNNVGNIAMGTTSGMYFTDNQPTERHQYHYSFENGAGKFKRDDNVSITRAFSSPSYSAVFALFCSTVKYEGGSTYFNDEFKFIGKLYGMTMTYEGEPLLELIPCYRKSDNVIGLYDMVGGTFYTNNGTGTFTKGDDV